MRLFHKLKGVSLHKSNGIAAKIKKIMSIKRIWLGHKSCQPRQRVFNNSRDLTRFILTKNCQNVDLFLTCTVVVMSGLQWFALGGGTCEGT